MKKQLSTEEYIQSLDTQVKKTTLFVSKKNKKFLIVTLSFTTFIFLFSIGSIFINQSKLENVYINISKNNISDFSPAVMEYKDSYLFYENDYLGNENSLLLNGGSFAKSGIISLFPNQTYTDTILSINDKQRSLCGSVCSYINIIDETIYFRKNSDRKFYVREINGNVKKIADFNCGQVTVDKNQIYFINFDDNSSLYKMNKDGTESKCIIAKPIDNFILMGEVICIKTSANEVFKYTIESNKLHLIKKSAEQIGFNGKLVFKRNDIIIATDLNGFVGKTLLDVNTNDFKILCVSNKQIYYQVKKSLFCYDLETKLTKELCNEFDVYKEIYSENSILKIITIKMNEESDNMIYRTIEINTEEK